MKVLAAIGAIVVALPAIVIVAVLFGLWHAYVAHCLWDWHAVPRGLPVISTSEFYVALMLKGVLFSKVLKPEKDERETSENVAALVAALVVLPAVTLLIGWWLK